MFVLLFFPLSLCFSILGTERQYQRIEGNCQNILRRYPRYDMIVAKYKNKIIVVSKPKKPKCDKTEIISKKPKSPFQKAWGRIGRKRAMKEYESTYIDEKFKEIIKKNPEIIHKKGRSRKNTLLHHAIECLNTSCVKILLEHNADINIKNDSGDACFSKAFESHRICPKDTSGYTIINLLAPHISKENIIDMFLKKFSYEKEYGEYERYKYLDNRLLKFINSSRFTFTSPIITTLTCLRIMGNNYKAPIPKYLRKEIINLAFETATINQVYKMKLNKLNNGAGKNSCSKWFIKKFNKKRIQLTEEDFI